MTYLARTLALSVLLLVTAISPQRGEAVAGALAFQGNWFVDCFGCGVSEGGADFCVTGLVGTNASACGNQSDVHYSFTTNEPADATCVITGSAWGSTTGRLQVDINWTRLGAFVLMTTSGDITGAGTATFFVCSPLGNPCGGPIRAITAGSFTGTSGDGQQVTVTSGDVPLRFGCEVETATAALASADLAAERAPNGHDLVATCTFKIERKSGAISVVGRAHTGRHPTASATQIRCRLINADTGTSLYDEARTEPGTQARLEAVLVNPVAPMRLAICTRGEGWWGDAHNMILGFTCESA